MAHWQHRWARFFGIKLSERYAGAILIPVSMFIPRSEGPFGIDRLAVSSTPLIICQRYGAQYGLDPIDQASLSESIE